MNFKENIPKYKPKLISWLLTLAITITTFMQYPITTHAAGGADYKGMASALVDSTGDNSSGGTEKVVNGATVGRTGYLCYMLTVDGATVPGTDAVALKSPGYTGDLAGSGWKCLARQGGYTASTWSGTAPWNLAPWQAPPEGSKECVTNEPDIRAWMLEETSSGTPNAMNFVANICGEEVADKFGADEYILVIETIMNFQYSISNGGSGLTDAEIDAIIEQRRKAKINVALYKLKYKMYANAIIKFSSREAIQTPLFQSCL